MKYPYKFLISAITFTGICSTSLLQAEEIQLNQLGYKNSASKVGLVFQPNATEFDVHSNTDGSVVFSGKLTPVKYWEMAGADVSRFDFSDLKNPGSYYVTVGGEKSYTFDIKGNVYSSIALGSLRNFYLNRSSMALEPEYAGDYARPSGYPDTEVYLHESAATQNKPAGYVMSSPGGWFDAGDYGKYIVNSSISSYTLLRMFDLYQGDLEQMDLNIPESENDLPDVLDEIKYNLDWMLTMQDKDDGGVFSKLTTKSFIGFIMPEASQEKRYVFKKTTAASLDFAATMAYASRVFKTYLPDYATSCFMAAEAAWQWALDHPSILYTSNPDGVNTGTYGDTEIDDEWEWAATEMAITSGDKSYLNAYTGNRKSYDYPAWPKVEMLALFSAALDSNCDASKDKLLREADKLISLRNNNAAHIPLGPKDLEWGSNGNVSNIGMMMLICYKLTGEKKYLDTAQDMLDYLLGRNPVGYCYITGYGDKSPLYPHHRLSHADGVEAPYPGMIVGGANRAKEDGNQCKGYPESDAPAMCYSDELGSYASNEIAINWSAPFAFLVNGINSLTEE
jgi:endoglucanase